MKTCLQNAAFFPVQESTKLLPGLVQTIKTQPASCCTPITLEERVEKDLAGFKGSAILAKF